MAQRWTIPTRMVDTLYQKADPFMLLSLQKIRTHRKGKFILNMLMPQNNKLRTCWSFQTPLAGSTCSTQVWDRSGSRRRPKAKPRRAQMRAEAAQVTSGKAPSTQGPALLGARSCSCPRLCPALPQPWHCAHSGCKHTEGGVLLLPSPLQRVFCSPWPPRPVQMHT